MQKETAIPLGSRVIVKKQTNKPQIFGSTLPPCKFRVEMKNIDIQ